MAGGQRVEIAKPAVTAWLGAGAITLGIGAALTAGAAVAGASTDDPGATSNSSAAAASHESATAAPPQAHSDDGGAPPKKKPRHRTEDTDASTSSTTTTGGPTSTDSDAKPAATHKRTVVTRAVKVKSHDDTTTAVAQSTAADTAAPKVAALPTAKATAKPANPVVKLNQAVNSFLHSIQVQYFNTPPKITGYTVPAGTTSTLATARSATATSPTAGVGIVAWFKKTFANTRPSVTVSTPVKNADGTYTGQATASDVDGDPLSIEYSASQDGVTTLTDHGDGTYTYTYVPSNAAATTPNFKYYFHFSAYEANAASHFHSFEQIVVAIAEATLGNLLRALDPTYDRVLGRYVPSDWAWGAGEVTIPIGPVVPPATT